jgi:nicotinamide-nucleotide amidase
MGTDELVRRLADAMRARDWRLVTAESCTGGGIAAAVTDLAGSSDWFDRAFVTYSNQAKQDMLGVPAATLDEHGAVSRETVIAMARGAIDRSGADLGVAVSGVAGPGGGSEAKPVGTVWFAWSRRDGETEVGCEHFPGDRAAVRAAAVHHALRGLLERVA